MKIKNYFDLFSMRTNENDNINNKKLDFNSIYS